MSQSFDQNSAVYRCSYSGWLFVRDWKIYIYIYINVLFRLSFLPKGFSFVSWSAWKISANPLSPLISPAVYKDCPLSMLTAGVLTSYTGNIQNNKMPCMTLQNFSLKRWSYAGETLFEVCMHREPRKYSQSSKSWYNTALKCHCIR